MYTFLCSVGMREVDRKLAAEAGKARIGWREKRTLNFVANNCSSVVLKGRLTIANNVDDAFESGRTIRALALPLGLVPQKIIARPRIAVVGLV